MLRWPIRRAPHGNQGADRKRAATTGEKVDRLAERLERSPGWIVEQALAAWVDQQEEHRCLTLVALADVDAGRVIDHQAVRTWADSLGTSGPLPPPRVR